MKVKVWCGLMMDGVFGKIGDHSILSAQKLLTFQWWIGLSLVCIVTCRFLKMAVFWDVAPCSMVEVYRRFRDACSLHHHVLVIYVSFRRIVCSVVYSLLWFSTRGSRTSVDRSSVTKGYALILKICFSVRCVFYSFRYNA
jgi:hypothetical protein